MFFLGERADVPALLQTANLVVVPSRWEGLPMAALEAMAAGKPIIATSVGGLAEIIEDGVTGFLVPPEDPKRLAESIASLLRSTDMATCVGTRAREFVQTHFSIDLMTDRILGLYGELLKNVSIGRRQCEVSDCEGRVGL